MHRFRRIWLVLLGLVAALAVIAVGLYVSSPEAREPAPQARAPEAPAPPARAGQAARRAAASRYRNVYFGDLHVHTGWSADAFTQGVRTTPDDAYRYAKGEAIEHAAGYEIELMGPPLDFYAVTDHAEYMGVLPQMLDPDHPLSRHPLAEKLAGDPDERREATLAIVASVTEGKPIPALVDPEVRRAMWQEIIDAAERHYEPGKFTTFIGYEWTSNGPDGYQNLHRSVIFRGSNVVDTPLSALDSNRPEELWAFMDRARQQGIELIAIPHSANLGDGSMFPSTFPDGRPLTAAYAERRMRNEPLVEVTQIKGSYVRDGYKTGLLYEEQTGRNPYRFGMIGSSDTHNSGAPIEEYNYFGKLGMEDGTAEARLLRRTPLTEIVQSWGASGLVGVWAEDNTREAIFDALVRKETFATTGPRIPVRFFGGWAFSKKDSMSPEMVALGYQKGVPMGSDLPARSAGDEAPSFLVWAVKDPDGANLDRVQIVKGWTRRGQTFEKVYDVVWSGKRKIDPRTGRLPPVGNTVDVAQATFDNSIGHAALAGVWTDPDFDPGEHAFYYVRVLQIPTPRWSTYDAVRLGIPPPPQVPATLQERAYTSPIWYTPTRAERARVRERAMTVARLEEQGARALSTRELRDVVVGDRYLAARSDEAGYVNDEVRPAGQ